MNYTKGERNIYCGDDYWFVEVKDSQPACIIGKFHTKGDAILDAAAPDMYEALKEIISDLTDIGDCRVTNNSFNLAEQALAKAECK